MITTKKIEAPVIRRITGNYPYSLLLLADETVEGIDKYLRASDVYVAEMLGNSDPIGVFCLLPIDDYTVEIMNIAVTEAIQGNGIGSQLLKEAENIAKETNLI